MRKLIPAKLTDWWGGRENAALSLPAPGQPESNAALRRRLAAEFDRALYGLTFRTCAFPGTLEGETEYFKALATTPLLDRWDIQKITSRAMQLESSAQPVGTENTKLTVVQSGLGFFEALDYLARFEVAQEIEPIGPSIEALGNQHYLAFGLLHNIAFNLQGLPQPTIGGHIAISDQYPDSVLAQLEEMQKKSAEKAVLAAQTTAQARSNGGFVAAGFEKLKQQAGDYAKLAEAYKAITIWYMLADNILADSEFTLAKEKEYEFYRNHGYSFSSQIDDFEQGALTKNAVLALYDVMSKKIQEMKLRPQEQALIQSYLTQTASFFLLEQAKRVTLALASHPTSDAYAKRMITLAAEYAGLNPAQNKERVQQNFLATAASEKPFRKIPKFIQDFTNELYETLKAMEEESTKTMSAIKAPAP